VGNLNLGLLRDPIIGSVDCCHCIAIDYNVATYRRQSATAAG
jgi:hypothetical protein